MISYERIDSRGLIFDEKPSNSRNGGPCRGRSHS